MSEVELKERIPLWLAVAITVVVALPFGLYLKKFNIPLWVCFIIWAQYFALGAKTDAFKIILPSYAVGVIMTAASMFTVVLLKNLPSLYTPGDLAIAISLFGWISFMVYGMKWSETLQKGIIPFFNGISMLLGVYFTASYPAVGNAYIDPWMAGFWAIVAGWLGALLGWFNVLITFPRKVSS